jgi:hypothetical protein
MKIRPVGAEAYHRQTRTKLKADFRHFANAAKVAISAHECKQRHIQTEHPYKPLTVGFVTERYVQATYLMFT